MFEGSKLHLAAKFLDEKKQNKFLVNLEGITLTGKLLKGDPFKKLLATVNLSKRDGSLGPRGRKIQRETTDEKTKESIDRLYEEIQHDNSSITRDLLEEIYVRQDGKCYWSKISFVPETNGTSGYCLSMSPDRLDNDGDIWGDYTVKNIVISTQFANRGRCNINPEDFAWQCRQMGWEPMWFTDPRRKEYLKEYAD